MTESDPEAVIDMRIEDAQIDERAEQDEELAREFDTTDRIAQSLAEPDPS